MQKKQHISYFSASLMLHVLLLTFLLFQAKTGINLKKYGNSQKNVISSYLFNSTEKTPQKHIPLVFRNNEQRVTREPDKDTLALKLKKKVQTAANQQSTQAARKAAVRGEPMPELIARLHAAIQKQQQYPASAQEMEREGRATVAFTLHRNGTISNLRLDKSSGTASLDNAALAAVQRAAPFKNINKILINPQDFQLDVVFQLS